MACGCKKNKTVEQPVQPPPSNIRLTEVQTPTVTQPPAQSNNQ